MVLDKSGKLSYESPSSFRIIVLLQRASKILERIIATHHLLAAHSKGLIHPNQCGSLHGLSTYDACLTLMNDLKALQRARLKVSSLFLDIKAGFDNFDDPTLSRILREGRILHYLVSWVASFLGERSCTLVFQGVPGTPASIKVGAPHGSPISPLHFLIYIAPLHFRIPRGLTLSYVDDFTLTAASLSYRGNIRRLQELFRTIQARAARLGISFSVLKTELIHGRTPSQRHSQLYLSPIQLHWEIFHPHDSLRWLGYWFTPSLSTSTHFSRCVALAQGAFAHVSRLSFPGAGSPPTGAIGWQYYSSRTSFCMGRTFSRPTWAPSRGSTPSGTRCKGGPPTVSRQLLSASWPSSPVCPLSPSWYRKARVWPPSGQSAPCPVLTRQHHAYTPPSPSCPRTGPRTAQGPTPRASPRSTSP